jgi:hypothetical protein
MEDTTMNWRKSSYSGNGGDNCVEVADRESVIMVRDTKQHGHGQVHKFTAEEWCAFVASVKTTNLPAGQRASVIG